MTGAPLTPDRERQLRTASQRAAWISLGGVVLVLGALLFGGRALNRVQAELRTERESLSAATQAVASARAERDAAEGEKTRILAEQDRFLAQRTELEVQFNARLGQIRDLTATLDATRGEMAALQAERESLARQWAVEGTTRVGLSARVAALLDRNQQRRAPLELLVAPRAEIRDAGDGRFEYALWLETPAGRAEEIENVRYELNHPSIGDRSIEESTDRRGRFRVEYSGRGALRRVIVTVVTRDQKEFSLGFDPYEAVLSRPRDPQDSQPPVLPDPAEPPRRDP